MCAIFGVYGLDLKEPIDLERFRAALQTMGHRGPDNEGVAPLSDSVAFGHNRLAIIDLNEESNQPFFDDSGEFALVYNGEIFNYIEIREELAALGVSFSTDSDTEVLLKSYIYWGEECVSRFNGMWAFAVYERRTGKLFCSRDRFGIKPFYYLNDGSNVVFASEAKAILRYRERVAAPNYNLIANFCRTSVSCQSEETWFSGIFRLMPAHNMVIDKKKIIIKRYWSYPVRTTTEGIDGASAKYLDLFVDAVKLRTRSDVKVGLTLSAGIDSSSIAAVLSSNFSGGFSSFTACFDDRIASEYKGYGGGDESAAVKRLADELGIDARFIKIESTEIVDTYSKIVRHLECGQSYSSLLAVFRLFEGISRTGVKVVLEGQGADELLAGYYSGFAPSYAVQLLRRMNLLGGLSVMLRYFRAFGVFAFFAVLFRNVNVAWLNRLFFRVSGVESFFAGRLKDYQALPDSFYESTVGEFGCSFNNMLARSHSGVLLNLLHYGDSISMAFSIESRFPFLDHRLVEYVFSLPADYKIRDGIGKYLHRRAVTSLLPEYVVNSPVKLGFNAPFDVLFKDDAPGSIASVLMSSELARRGLFDTGAIRVALAEVRAGKGRRLTFLFRIFLVELWFREFIDAKGLEH